jgi:hypothetical protein
MDFDVTLEHWVARFAMRLGKLDVAASPSGFAPLGESLWAEHGHVDPESAADGVYAGRLGAATGTAAGPFQNTPGLGEEGRFERTERIPVERLQAADEYVRDNGEWVARCVARVRALDPIIKAEEARRSVAELAELERWRLMKPEAAADQLYTPVRPRSTP